MATYAVGDVQGCCDELQDLLDAVSFDRARDELWLVGDLVNRGPRSLATLRLVRELGDSCRVVLGNHDLHFLAIHYGGHNPRRTDTLDELLGAHDVDQLASWLRGQPLMHHDAALGWLMVHAGVPPGWSLSEALGRAAEAHRYYGGTHGPEFFAGMYGNTPASWRDSLSGLDRVRCIVNYLTRMRLIAQDGELEFERKGAPQNLADGLLPWFAQPRTQPLGAKIAFGHWAALEGVADNAGVAALDTGCVWGRELTALSLTTGELTAVPSRKQER